MSLTPEKALHDLETYFSNFELALAEDAKQLILSAELAGYKCNRDIYHYIFLPRLIEHIPQLKSLILRKDGDPDEAIHFLDIVARNQTDDDKYDRLAPYSEKGWRGSFRHQIADFSMAAALRNKRTRITKLDILSGFLEAHDEIFPPIDNAQWTDESLHAPYNTLAHIHGQFSKALWVKFEDIREELNLLSPSQARKGPIDTAPAHIKPLVMAFLADHSDYRKNCFLIMPFAETEFHKKIHSSLRLILGNLGINLLRADDKLYSDDVLSNIETYIYGCKFGIAIHDRVLSDIHNPNVALEIGYVLGQKKNVCLLKEKTVSRLPSDLQGRLYIEFDASDMKNSIANNLTKWLLDKNLLNIADL